VRTQYGHCLFLKQRNCLIVTIESPLSDGEFKALCSQVAESIVRNRSRCAVLDLSGLDVVDSFLVQNLQLLCATLQLYSVATMVTGIQPSIAISMAVRGLSLRGVSIAIDLTDALARLEAFGDYISPPDSPYPSLH
jgi:rsbT antagonist protein RsbS